MDEGVHIKDPKRLLNLDFQGFNMVKEVEDGCAFDRSVLAIDLKLDVRGPKEDEFYAIFPFLT